MRRVFDELQEHLRTLDADWSKTDEDKRFNYDYFRPIPSACIQVRGTKSRQL